jgi:Family of unknown function (DUF6308)
VELVYGAGRLDRRVPGVDMLLRAWRELEPDVGQLYLEHKPVTPPDRLLVEDLAVTMLLNSRVAARAAASVSRYGALVDLSSLPDKALEDTTEGERQAVARVIGSIARWPGFGASLATKTLHKKRPALIPVLDNQAIFGAYMNPRWPDRSSSSTDTVKDVPTIKEALDWIAHDLARPENESTWPHLQAMEPERSQIELFDMIWWMHFRQIEPSGQPGSSPRSTPRAEWFTSETSADGVRGDWLIFRGNDMPYLHWISEHPSGYVVNAERNPKPSYLKLHRTRCTQISGPARPGAYTERDYIKTCSDSRSALEDWAREEIGGVLGVGCACLGR